MLSQNTIEKRVEQIKQFDPEKIILFDSYATGSSTEKSDLDIFVIKNIEKQELRSMRMAIRRSLFPMIWDPKIELDLFVDNKTHVSDRCKLGDPFYVELTTKGTVLYAKE